MNATTAEADLSASTAAVLGKILEQANAVLLGKSDTVRLALSCLLARGHLLIEDIPGVGKTTLAHTLARVLGLPFNRIQFTGDLLPADVVGVSVYDTTTQSFRFHPGPIFSSVVLADEINRATPKAQSALLEAMEEKQVTAEGSTHVLPEPFFVIATQNPRHQIGTFPLPESQLDRFLMRIDIGFPDPDAERELLRVDDRKTAIERITPTIDARRLTRLQRAVDRIVCSEALLDYLQTLLQATREANWVAHGLSPRAGLALVRAAKAWALVGKRELVLPEDVQAVAPAVFGHRLQAVSVEGAEGAELVERLIRSVPVP